MTRLSRQTIDDAMDSEWDLGNSILYDMCKKYPAHTDEAEIVAKVWLIGRSYAAAIERRKLIKDEEALGDDFYFAVVGPRIKEANLDLKLAALKNENDVREANLELILKAHNDVMNVFQKISSMNKRSLASKYLHFHFPNLFPIYDSRAAAAVSKLAKQLGVGTRYKTYVESDYEYKKFCIKCLGVIDRIDDDHKIRLTPRRLDNLLLGY